MATLRRRLHRFNGTSYDVVHFETEASLVKMADGTTAEVAISAKAPSSHNHDDLYYREYEVNNLLNGKANSSHNHSAANITSGTLSVARGGTGVTSMDALKSALGIGGGSSYSGMSFNFTNIAVGQCVLFNYEQWLCVHSSGNIYYLVSTGLMGMTQFGSNTTYSGSILAATAKNFESRIAADSLAKCINWTVNGVTQKVNIPSYEQYNGGFSYFSNNDRRVCDAYWYWTSSPCSSSCVWRVGSGGGLSASSCSYAGGFRPCVAISL